MLLKPQFYAIVLSIAMNVGCLYAPSRGFAVPSRSLRAPLLKSAEILL
jgi:hypothetical protein